MIGRIEYQTADGVATQHVMTLQAPGVSLHWVLLSLNVVYDGIPPSADITITGLEGATSLPILKESPGSMRFERKWGIFVGNENTAVVVTVPAGGASVRSLVYVTAVRLFTRQLESISP